MGEHEYLLQIIQVEVFLPKFCINLNFLIQWLLELMNLNSLLILMQAYVIILWAGHHSRISQSKVHLQDISAGLISLF